ncbi:hypothetical protein D9758_018907 [Tetrapyrgos nigripes]|uniref:NACHT domain-containing protein n=1 Tax=Tetrapyrgos nigripes TaxID=182062 RepID=A0A8H5B764_9AGAR|nr:hypothetical protein D9758_018907 [Tetrapyrgos nigripes]
MRLFNSDIHFATPPVPGIFTGRDDLVNEGVEVLCREGRKHLAILGPGGIGKTSLALVISDKQEVQAKFQNRYFLPCDILQDQNDLVQGFIQALGLEAQERKSQHKVLFDHLNALQVPALFILDNFETPWNYKDARAHVSNFIKKLVRFNHVTLIVTMRGIKGPGHPDIKWNKLGAEAGIPTLPIEAAREAFYLISGKSRAGIPEERLDHLLKELDCVPLAIRLVAQLAETIDLENLIRMWDKSKTEILSEPDTEPGKLTSVEYSIELSVKLLQTDTKDLLAALAYLPNGIPNWNITTSQMFSKVQKPEIQIYQLLACSLVLETNQSLMMLAPVREYILARYNISDFLRNQIEIFYVGITELISSDSKPGGDLELHTLNLFKTFSQYQGQGDKKRLHSVFKHWEINITVFDQYSNAAKFLTEARVKFQNINNEYEAANCLRQMGDIHRMQSRYNEAIAILAEAKSRFEQIRSEEGIADCLWSLGDIYRCKANIMRQQRHCPKQEFCFRA